MGQGGGVARLISVTTHPHLSPLLRPDRIYQYNFRRRFRKIKRMFGLKTGPDVTVAGI
jgi:hypothetical protein